MEKKGKYVEIWENLKAENQKLLIFLTFLIVVIFLLLMTVINLAIHRTVTITIPSSPPVVIQFPSKELGLWWARHYVNLLGNFSPETVESQYSLVAMTATPELREKITKEIVKIKENKISQDFLPLEGSWKFKEGGIIKVKGYLKRWIGNDLVENKRKTMVVKLKWSNGKFLLEDWWYEG